MTTESDSLVILKEIRDLLKQDSDSQIEMENFYKQQIMESSIRGNEALELQKSAVKRLKFMQKVAVPLLILCIAFISYLLIRI